MGTEPDPDPEPDSESSSLEPDPISESIFLTQPISGIHLKFNGFRWI